MAKAAPKSAPAVKTKAPPVEVKKPGTAVVSWQERMEQEAAIAAGMEANAGGGQFFSMKGGILMFNDMPIPNNRMAVVVTDSILENVFYEGEYDPSTPSAPLCFAYARDEAEMAPHKTVVEAGQEQHETCHGCPMNAWGTADKGKGKACRNTRRLALIPAGDLDANGTNFKPYDEDHFERAAIGFMKLPVTSVKAYASFVKSVAGTLKLPPFGIFTRVTVIPDAATQFKVQFEPLKAIPESLMETMIKRHDEAMSIIDFPYPLELETETVAKPAKGKASPAPKRPPAKGGKKKY